MIDAQIVEVAAHAVRSASGSVDSPSAVEPTRSQKRTVTTLRCSRVGSASERGSAGAAEVSVVGVLATAARACRHGEESKRVARPEARPGPSASARPRRRCPSARGERAPLDRRRRLVDSTRARESLRERIEDVRLQPDEVGRLEELDCLAASCTASSCSPRAREDRARAARHLGCASRSSAAAIARLSSASSRGLVVTACVKQNSASMAAT